VVLACGLALPALFVYVAARRDGFPYPFEWMEGAMAAHVDRVRHGLPLYVAPSMGFVPFTYTPLYVWAAAGLSAVVREPLVALRLLAALSSLACMAFLALGVRRRGGGAAAAVAAALVFASCFRASGYWFDVARNDTFALAWCLLGLALLAPAPRPARAAVAGLAMAAAVLAKQSFLLVAAAAFAGLAIAAPVTGIVFAVAAAIGMGVPMLLLQQVSGGWFSYWVWWIPSLHAHVPGAGVAFFTRDLVRFTPAAALVALALLGRRPRAARRHAPEALALGALVLVALLTRMRAGSFENVLLPAFAALAWATGRSLDRLLHAGAPRALVPAATALLAAQFALGLFAPAPLVPAPTDRAAYDQLVAALARTPGDAWVPGEPRLAERAGKPAAPHFVALVDALLDTTARGRTLARTLEQDVARGRWELIVLDDEAPGQPRVERWLRETIRPHYAPLAPVFAPAESTLGWMRTGHRVRPAWVWRRVDAAR